MGIGTLVHEMGVRPDLVTGHDFRGLFVLDQVRARSPGMMAAGLRVKDIGLALSPMAYFGQFELDCPCVAMVTASHNDNGWTGVKMGADRPDDLRTRGDGPPAGYRARAAFKLRDGGAYDFVENFPDRYIADLTNRPKIKRKLKVVAACGNGTAGAFAPKVLEMHRVRGDPARRRSRLHLPAL